MGVELFDTLTNRISELKSEHRALDGQLEACLLYTSPSPRD